MAPEDQREAVKISVGLSQQLMAAALAMITVMSAFIVYIMGNRRPSAWFYVTAAVTFMLFVASIFIGGRGISRSRAEGFDGSWSLVVGKNYFNKQAFLCLLGLMTVILAFFLNGSPKESDVQRDVVQLRLDINEWKKEVDSQRNINQKTAAGLAELEKKLNALSKKKVPQSK